MEIFRSWKRLPHLVGRRLSWVVVVVALLGSGALLGAGIEPDTIDNSSANLPADAESALAGDLVQRLDTSDVVPAFVVVDRGGEPLTADDRSAVEQLLRPLAELAAPGEQPFPAFAEDGEAALVGVPLRSDLPEEERNAAVEELRQAVTDAGLPDGLQAQVTGGPAFGLDLSKVFDGADTRLLLVTAGVVALLLLITYRSPWLWLVPLTVVAVGDQVAASLVAVGLPAAAVQHRRRVDRHHVGARVRRRHQLRPAAHRPLPRGAAPHRGPLRRHAPRDRPGRPGDPGQLRHRRPRPALPGPGRQPDQPQHRLRRRHRHRHRRRSTPCSSCPPP